MKIPLISNQPILTSCRYVSFAVLLVLAGLLSTAGQEVTKTPDSHSNEKGELSKPDKEAASQDQSKIGVVFDETQPGVVFIESNGEKIRIDTAKKTVEH